MEERLPKGTLGGQAVIEGVMMKGPDSYSVAVRKPDKKIEVKLHKYESFGDRHKFAKLPFIRGVVSFVESLVVGMKTLSYSSSFYDEDEVETKADRLFKDIFKEKAESVILGFTILLSVVIAVALFMLLPAAIAEILGKWISSHVLVAVIEGIIRLLIFLIYVVLISQMEDIKRVFMYHGAEHKTINCLEAGVELTTENVDNYSRLHKRCGTSFIFIVMIISMVFFFFIRVDTIWLRIVLRLLFLPLVAGVSYEFIRLAGSSDHPLVQIFSKPGLALQKLTTKEPDHSMIEVAIASVEGVFDWREYLDSLNKGEQKEDE